MRAWVTGANGHLGFNLVQALLARGDHVRTGARSVVDVDKCQALRALPGVELVDAGLEQPTQLRAARDGIDTLFHVAALFATTEPGRDAEILRTAIEGTEASSRGALIGAFRFGVPVGNVPFIDVRDVVDAHLRVADRAIGGWLIAAPGVAPRWRRPFPSGRSWPPGSKPTGIFPT